MDNLRELQLLELDILKEVLKLFEEHRIPYFALGGTMLGAVRHKGFIPWDDDIDIGVPREHFERLSEICKELPDYLHFQTAEADSRYLHYFAKVENSAIEIHSNRSLYGETEPAWIDVFPLDGMPNKPWLRRLHGWNILAARALFVIARFDEIANIARENRPKSERTMMWIAKTFKLQFLLGKRATYLLLDKTLKRFPYLSSDYNINAMGAYKLKELFNKKVFGDGRLYPFEDIQIRGPQDYETYLTQLYGDWRKPQDFEHHKVTKITINDD